MRYDQILPAILALVAADPAISGVVGTAIREARTGEFVVPSLEWTFVAGRPEEEMLYQFRLQLDPFARTVADYLTVRNRLIQLLHRDREWTAGGHWVTSVFSDEQKAEPRDGVHSGPLDFVITVVRGR